MFKRKSDFDKGVEWGEQIVITNNKKYGSQGSVKSNKIFQTCGEYARGKRKTTKTGKTISNNDKDFYRGVCCGIVNKTTKYF